MSTPRIAAVSVTDAGAALAGRLPYAHHRGDLVDHVRVLWADVDGLVLVGATGIAVRAIGPLLGDKHTDPAVVSLDDQGRWAIALAGGHQGGNDLAREVAGLVGAEPVVTTATDAADVPALDTLVGFHAEGGLAGLTRTWLDGQPPVVSVDRDVLPDWPLPAALAGRAALSHPHDDMTEADTRIASDPHGVGPPSAQPRPQVRVTEPEADGAPTERPQVRVTDRAAEPRPVEVLLRPESLVVGVGSSSGADPAGLVALVDTALRDAGLSATAVGAVVSVDLKRHEPAIVALADRFGVPLRTFPATTLAAVAVPHPSPVVAAAVGTPSVAEAAALEAAGPGASLVVPKVASNDATVAVARRRRPAGHLAVVGLGPGDPGWRTPAASAAVRAAELVVGYGPYVDQATDLLRSSQEVVRSPIGAEAERCNLALAGAALGRRVALVCSGDPGVYAMASLVCELAPDHGDPEVTVVPGVTAALGGAALLGAPFGHDHAAISLSDLLTPWSVIERRLTAVAEGDLAVALYNPRSGRRTWQLGRALAILAEHRPATCPVAVLAEIGRQDQRVRSTTLGELDEDTIQAVDMLSLVVVGASTTRWIGDRMVTPRGYPAPAPVFPPAAPPPATAEAGP